MCVSGKQRGYLKRFLTCIFTKMCNKKYILHHNHYIWTYVYIYPKQKLLAKRQFTLKVSDAFGYFLFHFLKCYSWPTKICHDFLMICDLEFEKCWFRELSSGNKYGNKRKKNCKITVTYLVAAKTTLNGICWNGRKGLVEKDKNMWNFFIVCSLGFIPTLILVP